MSTEESNELIRRHDAVLNSGRFGAGLNRFADPCLFNGQPIGREVIRGMRTMVWTATADAGWSAEHIVAEGDWVAMRWTVPGAHAGRFVHPSRGSARACGKPVALTYLDHYRIAVGRIAVAWEARDRVSLREEFGMFASERPAS
jgi:predicted ester cyclase